MNVSSGHTNGDGRADATMVYRHADNSISLYTDTTNTNGRFNPFNSKHTIPANSWDWNSFRTITGDYNGDGRADLAVMYTHSNGNVWMMTSLADDQGLHGPFTTSLVVPN